MKNLLLALSLIGMCTFWACGKEDITTSTETNSDQLLELVTLENGVLVFDSRENFDNLLKQLREESETMHETKFDSKFSNFKSNRQAFDVLTEEIFKAENGDMAKFEKYAVLLERGGEKYLEPLIDHNIMSQIANENGVFKVGDKIMKINYDQYLELNEEDYLPSLTNKEIAGLAIKTYEIKRTGLTQEKRINGYCAKIYEYSNSGYQKRKSIGEWITYYAQYANGINGFEAMVRTSNYKRGFLGYWYLKKAFKINQFGTITIKDLNGNVIFPTTYYSLSIRNTNRHEWRLPILYPTGISFSAPSSFEHSVLLNAGDAWSVCNIVK